MGMNTNCYGVVSDVVIMINTDLAGNERTRTGNKFEEKKKIENNNKNKQTKTLHVDGDIIASLLLCGCALACDCEIDMRHGSHSSGFLVWHIACGVLTV